MKVVVGLGNPGKEYEKTRHNIGFFVLDSYLGNVKWKECHKSLIYESKINNEKVLFVKPQTFMNSSGEALREIVNFYKISPDDILIIQDDISLELGKFRIKYDSTDGGHNGIKSILKELHTNMVPRLKIGLSKEKPIDTISYVLGKLTKKEINQLNIDKDKYFHIIDEFINHGKDKVMMM